MDEIPDLSAEAEWKAFLAKHHCQDHVPADAPFSSPLERIDTLLDATGRHMEMGLEAAAACLSAAAHDLLDRAEDSTEMDWRRAEASRLDAGKALHRRQVDIAEKDLDRATARIASHQIETPRQRLLASRLVSARGYYLYFLDDKGNRAAALAAYDEAIGLQRDLDLDVPQYRDGLAGNLYNKGNVLNALGDHAGALAAYDDAIGLQRDLDLTVPQYRSNLANSLTNKGAVLDTLGDFAAALAAFDEAIGLQRGLDLAVPQYRNALATSLTNKASILAGMQIADVSSSVLALVREAYDLLQGLVTRDRHFDFQAASHFPLTCRLYMRALGEVDRWSDAVGIGKEGLAVMRHADRLGWNWRVNDRDALLRVMLEACLRSGQLELMPLAIVAELDPNQPGSGWRTQELHIAAAEWLHTASEVATRRGGKWLGHLPALSAAEDRLADLAERCFAGTVVSEKLLTLQKKVKSGGQVDLDRMNAYVRRRPLDPEGPMTRATFRVQRGEVAEALADYQETIRLILHHTPRPEPIAVENIRIAARSWLNLRLEQVQAKARADGTEPDDALEKLFLLRDDLGTLLRADAVWSEALAQAKEAVWTEARSLLSRLTQEKDAAVRHALIEAMEAANRKFVATSLALLPRNWAGFVERLTDSWNRVIRGTAEGWSEEQIDGFVDTALRGAMDALDPALLRDDSLTLRHVLGDHDYPRLREEEIRHLATALHCRKDTMTAKFAVMELGIAVEQALRNRLFEPIRMHFLQNGLVPPPLREGEEKERAQKVYHYLAKNRPAELGSLVGAFTLAIDRMGTVEGNDLIGLLAAILAARPGAAALTMPSPAIRQSRNNALDNINDLRNDVAHAKCEPTGADIDRAWDAAVANPDLGFFRYFPAVFAEPEKVPAHT